MLAVETNQKEWAATIMRWLCVFCGSKIGNNPNYKETAVQLGELMASRGLGLVYGGGSVGLMGAIAEAVLQNGGDVIGVIPEALDRREIIHRNLTELHIVPTMHHRKALMTERSDAFIAIPGGYGTLDELFESITWLQLGIHRKPVGLLNVKNYFDHLLAMINLMVDEGFVDEANRQLLQVETNMETLLDKLATFKPEHYPPKWSNLKP